MLSAEKFQGNDFDKTISLLFPVFFPSGYCIMIRKRYTVKIELTIYQLKRYSPTNIISLALWFVSSKVGLTTCRTLTCLRYTMSFIPLRYRKSRGTSHYTTQGYGYMCIYKYKENLIIYRSYKMVLVGAKISP